MPTSNKEQCAIDAANAIVLVLLEYIFCDSIGTLFKITRKREWNLDVLV